MFAQCYVYILLRGFRVVDVDCSLKPFVVEKLK